MSSFLRGQLIIALILAAINGVGLTLLGVPMGLLVGIVAGLANMIPYMALVVGLAPALLLSWIEHQSVARLVGVLLIFGGAQLLEGTVLSPKILSKSVDLHPVWILLAIIVGGRLFGLPGMLVAVPAAAGIQVFARHWLVAYRRSSLYGADAEVGAAAAAPAPPPPEA
jgi:predicted PurR-regulated permease PerM